MPYIRPPAEKQASIDLAIRLINEGWSTSTIRTLLQHAFQYSHQTAMRDHNEAEAVIQHDPPPEPIGYEWRDATMRKCEVMLAQATNVDQVCKLARTMEKLHSMGKIKKTTASPYDKP